MSNRRVLCTIFVSLAGALAAAVSPASAQPYEQASASAGSTASFDSRRAKTRPSMLMSDGSLTVGADISFVTAAGGLGAGEILFTDLVLLRPRLRYALGDKSEVFAGTTLLPKQPSFTDELVWQGGYIGALFGISRRFAVFAQAAGGPLMDSAGWWTGFDTGVQARKVLEKVVVFQGALGGSGSFLWFDEDTAEQFWFAEVAAHGEILFQPPRGEVGAWIGVDYRVPVAHNPSGPDALSGASLDPQTRVNFHMGFVLAALKGWDLYVEYSILDRGDIEAPATTLPILEGGFDQRHLVFGILRRYNIRTAPRALIAR
jgi:hypothetical protein